jgi:hypothetical protein
VSDDSRRCKDHPADPAVALCVSCRRPVCDLCFRFLMNERAACARCAYETATRPQRRISLAVFFLGFAGVLAFWLSRRYAVDLVILLSGGVLAVVIAGALLLSARDPKRPEVVPRDVEEDAMPENPFELGPNPYRAQARRVLLAVSPRVSGRATAFIVVFSSIAAAVLVPASVRLPRWVEAEVVLGLWWAILAGTIGVLLYRGFRLRDDVVYFVPWDRPADPKEAKPKPKSSGWGSGGGCSDIGSSGCGDGCSSVDGEGFLVMIAVVVVLGVALGAAWIFVEIALPLAAFLMYALLMRAIRFASRDQRGCEGDLARSLGRGVLFATIYVLPLVLLTWGTHALLAAEP